MVNRLTSHFKVETIWPELVNKRIEKIDLFLKEIQFVNRNDFLLANGSIKREIRYYEIDGRLRKAVDRIQFEVVLTKSILEPMPYFKSLIKNDYFVFQPKRLGENQAVLEQGFILEAVPILIEQSTAKKKSIMVDAIELTGQGNQSLQIKLALGPEDHPKDFKGTVKMEKTAPHLEGMIEGQILYTTVNNQLKELAIKESFILYGDFPKTRPEQNIIINVKLNHSRWWSASTGQGWVLELELDYRWQVVTTKKITCLVDKDIDPHKIVKIKTFDLLEPYPIKIVKLFEVPITEEPISQIQLNLIEYKVKKIKNALILSGLISAEIYFISESTAETYRTFNLEFNELLTEYANQPKIPDNAKFQVNLDCKFISSTLYNNITWVKAELLGDIRTLCPYLTEVMEDHQSDHLIRAQVHSLTKEFSFFQEAEIILQEKPALIRGVQAKVTDLRSKVTAGRLFIEGIVNLWVSYINNKRQNREEFFNFTLSKHYTMNSLNQECAAEVEAQLDYDSYTLNGTILNYKYLCSIKADLFEPAELRLAVPSEPAAITAMATPESLIPRQLPPLLMEKEVPLRLGKPTEAFFNHSKITDFKYRSALNALLVEGVFSGEVEYWDVEGYLRKEIIEYSFWKFIPESLPDLDELTLIPLIQNCSCIPVNPWPWEKGSLKISVELRIKHYRNEGEDN